MTDRTATDTIKGYFYQFDFAILQLLELPNDPDSIIVEGIEDVDISSATEQTAIQCKYYARTEYNHSVIAKPIRLMLNHYKDVINGKKQKVNYKLYGYFQTGQNKLTLPIDSTFLKDHFLTYSIKKTKYFHHINLALSELELDDFISLLNIDIYASEYQDQIFKIINLLSSIFSCNAFEAEHYFYNNALKVIKDIAVDSDIKKRKITKQTFLKKINNKSVLFNEWFVAYKGEAKLFTELRKQYFTDFNVSPFERFFLIEIPDSAYIRSELKDLILTISSKWSKLSKREPTPFCPYFYFHGIDKQELVYLKEELSSENYIFVDGFDFHGSSFNPKSITKSANYSNSIRMKILNEYDHIELTLAEIFKTKEIFEFYCTVPFLHVDYVNIKQVKIQYSKLTDIKRII